MFKKKKGETSLTFLPSSSVHAELYKPEFSTTELSKQATMVDSTKDHNTSLTFAQVIILSNYVVDLAKEGSKEI